MMKNYTVHKITISNGESIAYRKSENFGENIILLHGNMSSSIFWQRTMELLEADFSVYAPDLRGFGDSSYNTPIDSLSDFSEDLNSFMEVLNIKKSYIVGWSTGGGIAMDNSNIRLNNVNIQNNVTGNYGGGIFATNSHLIINNVAVSNNNANGVNGSGGGIFLINCTHSIINLTVNSNNASRSGANITTFQTPSLGSYTDYLQLP